MYDWVRRGKIPHIRIGRNKRIRESDLIDWMEQQHSDNFLPSGQLFLFKTDESMTVAIES